LSTTLTASGARFFYSAHTLMRLWDLLEHPFYERWSAGVLTPTELAAFAAQYELAAEVIAKISELAVAQAPPDLQRELEQHARVEAHHVELWRAFRAALPHALDATPTSETTRCTATWIGAGEQPLERHLAVLYAIGATRARVSRSELTALANADAIPDHATEYLALHAGLDAQRARCARRMLEPLLTPANTPQLVHEVGAALHIHWELLTSMHRLSRTPAAHN
jgi:pyrroloquinoline-quinone synthase